MNLNRVILLATGIVNVDAEKDINGFSAIVQT